MRFIALGLILAFASAANLSSQQLVAQIGEKRVLLNNQEMVLAAPIKVVAGKTMLPLKITAELLRITLVTEPNGSIRFGTGYANPKNGSLYINKQLVDTKGSSLEAGILYVSAKLFAKAIGANLQFAERNQTIIITTPYITNTKPLLPQARFLTDKTVYNLGEPVIYTDYSFDPEGLDLVSHSWQGKEVAFFEPGIKTITLSVRNINGAVSSIFSRSIEVTNRLVNTPLSYALRYRSIGEIFQDSAILEYPVAPSLETSFDETTLLVSNSPETPIHNGILYQDIQKGSLRLLAYHVNDLDSPSRLWIRLKNLEASPQTATITRLGETAPTRIETTLGQGTLLDFLAPQKPVLFHLPPKETLLLHASSLLPKGTGVNLLMDLEVSGQTEIAFLMVEEGLEPSSPLSVLSSDGMHTRGSFKGANRSLRFNLNQLPTRIVIGDNRIDPALIGQDATTLNTVVLKGNYGILYTIRFAPETPFKQTVLALSPRGGLYKGVAQVDGQPIPLPANGVLTNPSKPIIFARNAKEVVFMPVSGSSLPVNLIIYPSPTN